jgi:hypothetical protein
MAKNGNGWHQGDWMDPNDPRLIPLFFSQIIKNNSRKDSSN